MNTKAARLRRHGRLSAEDLAWLFMQSQGLCPYCGIEITPLDCSFDHMLPFDAGGENTLANVVACCLTCQRQKARRLAHEFAEARVMVRQCEICGIDFRPRYADVRRGYGTTCSAICAGRKGRRTRDQVYA